MTALLDEDALKPYTLLRDVITDVMKPTNDAISGLNDKVDSISRKLDERYYQKDMIDEKFKAQAEEIQSLKEKLKEQQERALKLLAGIAGVLSLISWLAAHLKF